MWQSSACAWRCGTRSQDNMNQLSKLRSVIVWLITLLQKQEIPVACAGCAWHHHGCSARTVNLHIAEVNHVAEVNLHAAKVLLGHASTYLVAGRELHMGSCCAHAPLQAAVKMASQRNPSKSTVWLEQVCVTVAPRAVGSRVRAAVLLRCCTTETLLKAGGWGGDGQSCLASLQTHLVLGCLSQMVWARTALAGCLMKRRPIMDWAVSGGRNK